MSGQAMTEEPAGLLYRPDVVDPGEEAMLLGVLEGLDFRAVTMRGQTARRTVRLYGFDHDFVSRYPPGAGIGWHRDALELEPRSGYVLAGSARWAWQHSIPPAKALRYSVTFRSLRRR